MKNAVSSLGSARPSDYESSTSSSSTYLFYDSDIENISEKEKEKEEEESLADDSLYEMVPSEVIVPIEVPSVPKIPEIVKSPHGSSLVVTEVIDVDEPVMKVAAANWIMCGHAKSNEPPHSTIRLKAPPQPRPLKTMAYVSVKTAKLLLRGMKALRKDNASKSVDRTA
jgi:hypothetical protein